MKPYIALGACMVALMPGCSTVSVNDQWRDPSFAGPPLSNVLVVGITRSDTMKRVFEDVFSQQLQAAGIRAERSYARLPQGATQLSLSDLKTTGIDGVLTTRVERVEQKVNVTPSGPSYGGFYGWYGSAWASTPDVHQYEVVTLETSVWDVKSEKLVWTVTTQGVRTNDLTQATKDLASTLIPKLKSEGVLR
ncbi:DUF4136 domain-containing protein [Dyella japonica]|uniref:DUF4136 domain-containing protein n=1 Tax=Dyella japonica DSM 16301 TaxID=1440762 RepID=A0A0G9H9U2_9GAMM|nr:DUF4136 domain-containing protein [Dyella japonica]KLD66201.1 hypothetical protein Y882_00600 [Dyella japonica DSM 16301]